MQIVSSEAVTTLTLASISGVPRFAFGVEWSIEVQM